MSRPELKVLAVQQLDVPEAAGELRDIRVASHGEAGQVDVKDISPRVEQPLRLSGGTPRLGPARDIREDAWVPGVKLEICQMHNHP